MGTSSMLDVVGSFFIGGVLLVMGLRLDAQANETTAVYNGSYILQLNITTLVQMLEDDFRKIGYCADWKQIPQPEKAIRIADSTKLRYWTDVGNDGTKDSITYWLGPPSELSSTPNPRDCYLYRQVNNQTAAKMNLGVTQFRFVYKDANDDVLTFPITNTMAVYYMQISVKVESAVPYKEEYLNDASQYDVFWKQIRLVTKNLKNR